MKQYVFIIANDAGSPELLSKERIEEILRIYSDKFPDKKLPYQVFELGSEIDLRQFIPNTAVVGDLVRFSTGVVARIVPDDEAVLYVDTDKIGITDVAFYLENDGCYLVSKESYQNQDGSLRMEIPTMNLPGCLHYGYYAICNEHPDWEVYYSEKGLYQNGDIGETVKFDLKQYVGNTWSLRLNPNQPLRRG